MDSQDRVSDIRVNSKSTIAVPVPEALPADLMAAISEAVTKAITEHVPKAVDSAMKKWTERLEELEERCEAAETKAAKAEKEVACLTQELKELSVTNAMHAVDRDVYSRKWNLIIGGLPGTENEPENSTEAKVRDMAKFQLKIQSAHSMTLAACHRLSRDKNAPIIVKFINLNDRNSFLSNAKQLKNCDSCISISPDLPPILKDLRDEILKERKNLPSEQKKLCKIEYTKSWPYMTLKSNGNHYKPEFSVEKLVSKFYKSTIPAVLNTIKHV
jgi:hypothetical protein